MLRKGFLHGRTWLLNGKLVLKNPKITLSAIYRKVAKRFLAFFFEETDDHTQDTNISVTRHEPAFIPAGSAKPGYIFKANRTNQLF